MVRLFRQFAAEAKFTLNFATYTGLRDPPWTVWWPGAPWDAGRCSVPCYVGQSGSAKAWTHKGMLLGRAALWDPPDVKPCLSAVPHSCAYHDMSCPRGSLKVRLCMGRRYACLPTAQFGSHLMTTIVAPAKDGARWWRLYPMRSAWFLNNAGMCAYYLRPSLSAALASKHVCPDPIPQVCPVWEELPVGKRFRFRYRGGLGEASLKASAACQEQNLPKAWGEQRLGGERWELGWEQV